MSPRTSRSTSKSLSIDGFAARQTITPRTPARAVSSDLVHRRLPLGAADDPRGERAAGVADGEASRQRHVGEPARQEARRRTSRRRRSRPRRAPEHRWHPRRLARGGGDRAAARRSSPPPCVVSRAEPDRPVEVGDVRQLHRLHRVRQEDVRCAGAGAVRPPSHTPDGSQLGSTRGRRRRARGHVVEDGAGRAESPTGGSTSSRARDARRRGGRRPGSGRRAGRPIVPGAVSIARSSGADSTTVTPVGCSGSTISPRDVDAAARSSCSRMKRPNRSSPTTPQNATRSPSRAAPHARIAARPADREGRPRSTSRSA